MRTQIYMLPASWVNALTRGDWTDFTRADLRDLTARDLYRLHLFTGWIGKALPEVTEINVIRDARNNETPVYKTAFHDARRFQPHRVDCHEYQFVLDGEGVAV